MQLLSPFIKVNDAECFYCRTQLHLYTFDALDITLSPEGYPVDAAVIRTAMAGICPKCKRPYNMVKRGMRFVTAGTLPRGGYDNEETHLQSGTSKNEFDND